MTQAAMVAPYGSQMYQQEAHGVDLVALIGRQEAPIDALIAHIGGLVAFRGKAGDQTRRYGQPRF